MFDSRLDLIITIVKAVLACLFMFLLISLSPMLFTAVGSCLALMGKLTGTLFKASPIVFFSLSVIISLLWGLKVFLTSK